jgi:RimJ/RimL family protein N-acetyltransferase
MPLPPLTTDRLLLRQRREEDVPAILAMAADPEVVRFIGDGQVPEPIEHEMRVRACVDTDFGVGLGYWSVFLRNRPSDYLGSVVLSPVPDAADIELSYSLRRDAWGRGFATEAARAGLDWGFQARGLTETVALVYPDNLRSQRVIAKLGFVPAGIRHAYDTDLLFYRLDRASYLGQRFAQEDRPVRP